jgi:uncharacterized cupredoxin-like copper-binding protein
VRRTPLLAVTLASLALIAGAGASDSLGDSGRARTAGAGSNLQVTLVEYRLMLSEATVKAGPVDLEMIDAGMDAHDLRLRLGRSSSYIAEPLLQSGQRHDAVVKLQPGLYHLWCALPGHWKLGMHATLRVVR